MKKLLQFIGLVSLLAGNLFGQGHGAPFPICTAEGDQIIIQVAHNPIADEFLVVWEDARKGMGVDDDIYGQILNGDGTLKGPEIPVCTTSGHQWWPRLDFDPVLKQYLVVFEDNRNGNENGDIRGIFIKDDGSKVSAPTSDADTTFSICNNSADVYTVSVAFNYTDRKYLIVWGDFRNDPTGLSGTGADVYGQIVGPDGTLLSPPNPADAASNFGIATMAEYYESNADVSYSEMTNEWLVVYGTSIGYVLGQRVSSDGDLYSPDGSVGKIASFGTAIQLSVQLNNMSDCLNPRVQFNFEYHVEVGKQAATPWCEALAGWKGILTPRPDNDCYGQRVGFFWDGAKYIARYIGLNGTVSDAVSNFNISIQDDWPNPVELSYSLLDDEWLVAWGDWRKLTDSDIYGQRLAVSIDDTSMTLLADDRVNTVTDTENIEYQAETNIEGYVIGIAHSVHRNHFIVAYERLNDEGFMDVYGFIVHGTIPSGVNTRKLAPISFTVEQNYPNPFNPETTIGFSLAGKDYVTVTVFDIRGRKVKRILNAVKSAGNHTAVWDGRDDSGNYMTSGLYLYEVRTSTEVITKKMTLLR